MPIKFACPQCKNVMTVDSKFAGKKGKCNKCSGTVEVPAEGSANSPTATKPASASPKTTQPAQPSQAKPNQAGQPTAANRPGPSPAGASAAAGQPNMNAAAQPSVAGIKVAGPLGNVLDELTESDFNRLSPYQNVYSPPKPKAENNALIKKAEREELGDPNVGLGADGRPKLTSTLIVFAVLDILEAALLFMVTIALAIVGATLLDDIKDKVPMLGAGMAVFIVIVGMLATTMMASGLGLLTKQVWGYCVALFVYSFQLGVRLLLVIVSITDWERVLGPIFIAFCMLSCTAYFYQEECRRVYGLTKKSKLPLIFGGLGLGLSLLFGGGLFLLGVFAAAVGGSDAPAPP